MNCPDCGRFMIRLLVFALEAGLDVDVAAYWWVCNNERDCWYNSHAIPAPEYDWLYKCQTISLEALLDWPELQAEYEAMWARLPKSWKKRSVNVLLARRRTKKGKNR